MSFMSGTLESLLLYSGSQQSQGGKPLYSNAAGQSKEPVYTKSQSEEMVFTFTQSNSSRDSMYTDIQSEAQVYNLSQLEARREPEYDELRIDQSRQKESKSKSDLHRNFSAMLGKQLQRAYSQDAYEKPKLSKRRKSAACGSNSERFEPLRSSNNEAWNSLNCLATNNDKDDWSMLPGSSKHSNGGTSKSPYRTATQGSSSTGFSLNPSPSSSSSVNIMSMLGSKHSSAGTFVSTEDSTPSDKPPLSGKLSRSPGLSPIRKGPPTLAGVSSPRILDTGTNSEAETDKMLNNACFQAAISEGFGSQSQTLSYKVRPTKRFSYHMNHNRLSGTCSKHAGSPGRMAQWEQSVSQANNQQQDIISMSLSQVGATVESSGPSCSQDLAMDTSSSSSQGSKQDVFDKKYRYNHTALALQQSGLMKTTIKTAEILRRGKILQAELNKLRKETALFMRSVLSNPENQNFRELYMKFNHNKFVS